MIYTDILVNQARFSLAIPKPNPKHLLTLIFNTPYYTPIVDI